MPPLSVALPIWHPCRMSPQTRLRAVTVPNPNFARAHAADASNPPTVAAVVNIRESAVTTLAARGQLDASQVAAADRFRRHYEALGGRGVKAIDPGRFQVDGGKPRDHFTDAQMNAGRELAKCRALLGVRGYRLVSLVAGEGRSLCEIAAGKRERLTAADMLRWFLDDLAAMWHLASRRVEGR
ncbi:hypothetical protein [Mesorhizobium sp. M0244]|uniref:hypothetical protein n=1 Tax=Mesorhizobium sp. M0244 TaxID=2956926 RepID=UPI00333BEA32